MLTTNTKLYKFKMQGVIFLARIVIGKQLEKEIFIPNDKRALFYTSLKSVKYE